MEARSWAAELSEYWTRLRDISDPEVLCDSPGASHDDPRDRIFGHYPYAALAAAHDVTYEGSEPPIVTAETFYDSDSETGFSRVGTVYENALSNPDEYEAEIQYSNWRQLKQQLALTLSDADYDRLLAAIEAAEWRASAANAAPEIAHESADERLKAVAARARKLATDPYWRAEMEQAYAAQPADFREIDFLDLRYLSQPERRNVVLSHLAALADVGIARRPAQTGDVITDVPALAEWEQTLPFKVDPDFLRGRDPRKPSIGRDPDPRRFPPDLAELMIAEGEAWAAARNMEGNLAGGSADGDREKPAQADGNDTTADKQPPEPSDLRPATWFSKATNGDLYGDLLRNAVHKGRLKNSKKRGDRWHYSILEICTVYPEYASRIRSAETADRP